MIRRHDFGRHRKCSCGMTEREAMIARSVYCLDGPAMDYAQQLRREFWSLWQTQYVDQSPFIAGVLQQ